MNAESEPKGSSKGPLLLIALVALGIAVGGFLYRATQPRLVDELAVAGANTAARLKLIELGSEAVPDLIEVAQDPTHLGRADAIEILGRIGDPRAVPVLLAIEDPNYARVRIEALGQIEDPRTLPVLLEALHSSSAEVSLSALFQLVEREDAPIDELEGYLASGRPRERALAARAMGYRRHMPALQTLIEMLDDEEAQVRQEAGRALLQLGDPKGNAAVDRAVERGAVNFDE